MTSEDEYAGQPVGYMDYDGGWGEAAGAKSTFGAKLQELEERYTSSRPIKKQQLRLKRKRKEEDEPVSNFFGHLHRYPTQKYWCCCAKGRGHLFGRPVGRTGVPDDTKQPINLRYPHNKYRNIFVKIQIEFQLHWVAITSLRNNTYRFKYTLGI